MRSHAIPLCLVVTWFCLAVGVAPCLSDDVSETDRADRTEPLLELTYGGGPPPAPIWKLSVESTGMSRLVLESSRSSGLIGVFEGKLSEARLAELKRAINDARLQELDDEYPAQPECHDSTWVRIAVASGHQRKNIHVSEMSPDYPRGIKVLYDLQSPHTDGRGPRGIVSDIMSELEKYPVAAIDIRLDLREREFQVGEGIPVDVLVRNVGSEPVVVPSTAFQGVVAGWVSVSVQSHPRVLWEDAGGRHSTQIQFGGETPPDSGAHPARRHVKPSDVESFRKLRPGDEWRLRMPEELVMGSPGDYEVGGMYMTYSRHDKCEVSKAAAAHLVVGTKHFIPVSISVR